MQQVSDDLVEQVQPVCIQFVVNELAISFRDNDAGSSEDGKVLTRNRLFHSHFYENLCYGDMSLCINHLDHVLSQWVIDRSEDQTCFFDTQLIKDGCDG